MQGLTPYLQWRAWPLVILCGLLFAWALLASRIAKTV
jgi:apolipoprotein N-acyltransferase